MQKMLDELLRVSFSKFKSTYVFGKVGQIARNATRDAAKYIGNNVSAAGKAAQARIILPTGTARNVISEAETALTRIVKPIPGISSAPKVTTGLPGLGGIALKALGPIGAALSAHSLGENLAKGDYGASLADAAGAAAGGLQTFSLASSLLPASATAGGPVAAGTGLVGGGGAIGGGAAQVAPDCRRTSQSELA